MVPFIRRLVLPRIRVVFGAAADCDADGVLVFPTTGTANALNIIRTGGGALRRRTFCKSPILIPISNVVVLLKRLTPSRETYLQFASPPPC
jgi:hypothetical protein